MNYTLNPLSESNYSTRETIRELGKENITIKWAIGLYDLGNITWEQAMMLIIELQHSAQKHTIKFAKEQIETAWSA